MMDESVFVIIDKELRLIKTDLVSGALCIFDTKKKAENFMRDIKGEQKNKVELVERLMEFRKI
jgi:hypothetical protein